MENLPEVLICLAGSLSDSFHKVLETCMREPRHHTSYLFFQPQKSSRNVWIVNVKAELRNKRKRALELNDVIGKLEIWINLYFVLHIYRTSALFFDLIGWLL